MSRWIENHPAEDIARALVMSICLLFLLALGPSVPTVAGDEREIQPQVNLEPGRQSELTEFVWSGGITPSGAVVVVRLFSDGIARLHVSRNSDISNPFITPSQSAGGNNQRVLTFEVNGLASDTRYYYAVEVSGVLDTANRGQFHTAPLFTFDFQFAAGCCSTTGANTLAFDTIRNINPLFMVMLGDLHSESITQNSANLFQLAYLATMGAARQATLYRQTPLMYVWDDLDYGGPGSDQTSTSRAAAQQVYRQFAPHYPLPGGSGIGPIYQAFTIGRVRFVMTDLRSERSPNSQPDSASKSMMGSAQKSWFFNQLDEAVTNNEIVIWLSSSPWLVSSTSGDHWGAYATERREIANFVASNDIPLIALTGGVNMLAIDDGSNNTYASGGGAGFPVFSIGGLDQPGGSLGGPYSHGTIAGTQQFGVVTIEDIGSFNLKVILSGRDLSNSELIRFERVYSMQPSIDFGDLPASYNLSSRADDGARHVMVSRYLGNLIDGEEDADERPNADGDDLTGVNDDDGVMPIGEWEDGEDGGVIEVQTTGVGYLNGWIDWNNNGAFETTEHVISNTLLSTSVQTRSLDVPAGRISNITQPVSYYARFRYFSTSVDNPESQYDGIYYDGEVEDYHWYFSPSDIGLDDAEARSSWPWQYTAAIALLIIGLGAITSALAGRRESEPSTDNEDEISDDHSF